MKSYGNYSGLVAELYDLWFGVNPIKDISIYRSFLKAKPGPALEIGSGTGRLMLPLLKEGFEVEGIEPSPSMSHICQEKAKTQGLSPVIYQQMMQELSLPKKYTTIFIPFASFMILPDRNKAQEALNRFYAHLIPQGQLILSLFIPFVGIAESSKKEWRLRRQAIRPTDDADVFCHEITTYDLIEQIKNGLYRYEVIRNGKIISIHHDEQQFRWYTKYEFIMMLQKSGFDAIETINNYPEQEVPYDHISLLFRAIKN